MPDPTIRMDGSVFMVNLKITDPNTSVVSYVTPIISVLRQNALKDAINTYIIDRYYGYIYEVLSMKMIDTEFGYISYGY